MAIVRWRPEIGCHPMRGKIGDRKNGIQYSEAFKMEVVRDLEGGDLSFEETRRKYGIKGCGTIQRWLRKYGNGSRGKVVRVQKPEEINEVKELKKRIRQLEKALADSNIDAALERAYTSIALKRIGVTDVAEFKKKAAGKLATRR